MSFFNKTKHGGPDAVSVEAENKAAAVSKAPSPDELDLIARKTDPATSHEAAQDARKRSAKNSELLMDCLRASKDGLTSYQAATILQKPIQTISTIFAPLRRKGLLVDSGYQRKNPSGSWAIVWMINISADDLLNRRTNIDWILGDNERKTPAPDVLTSERQLITDAEQVIAKLEVFMGDHKNEIGFCCRDKIRSTLFELRSVQGSAASKEKNNQTTQDFLA